MNAEIAQLKKQNHLLKIGIALTTLFFIFVAAEAQKTKFKEIDAERINIVSPEGKLELVLSNRKLLPRAVNDGKELYEDRNMPGLIFYNDVGDECGGLVYKGKLDEKGNPASGMHFSMDRFGGDQQLALGHYEGNGGMQTGLNIYDRGIHKEYWPIYEEWEKATDEDIKKELMKKYEEAGGKQTTRAFFGRTGGKSAAVILADAKGKARIMMYVTPEGKPVLQFLGDSGEPIYSLPPEPEKKIEK
ncbi:MAG: hypothetical protein FWG02_04625 [Holophagaceae bacterium]|nr:hypothetical protein [Holophagaceae bacterium]